MNASSRGKLVIISGPSGAGKSTVVSRVMEESPRPLALSVSATTRAPRAGEENGIDYHFINLEEFQKRRDAGDFLECKEVFGQGTWYGTLLNEVTTGLNAGNWVILEIDVEGARAAQQHYSDAVTIFLHPGSEEELERRLRARGTESSESIRRRLDVAKQELASAERYQYTVVNRQVDQAVQEICDILAMSGDETKCSMI